MKCKEEYLEYGEFCPYCKWIYLDVGLPNHIEDNYMLLDMTCLDCGKTWQNKYKLIEVSEIE